MKKKSTVQARIDYLLRERKKWLMSHEPFCIFCGGLAVYGDLSHKIRRSYASSIWKREELQVLPLNTGLAHRHCHDIFDNDVEGRKLLPRYDRILRDIETIDPEYYALMRK